jgi:AcrR family transcriptional regulator
MKRTRSNDLGAPSGPPAASKPIGKRDRTRAALIEAASQLIAEEGYERLSMDKVATRAGMTKGSIYGNFASKEDLVMATFLATVPLRPPANVQPGGSLSKQLQNFAEDLISQAPHTRPKATKLVAFQLYALTHEDMRRRVAKENAAIYARMEDWIRRVLAIDDLPMPPAQFVRLLHVVSNGLLVAHALAPELIGADVVRAIFSALAGDAHARARRGTPSGRAPGAPIDMRPVRPRGSKRR